MNLPERIQKRIEGKPYTTDGTGLSGSEILIFDDCVLKIMKASVKNEETVQVMRWLRGKLPVPEVIAFEEAEGFQYLLMSRIPGEMACDESFLDRPEELLRLLAEALQMLWQVDISGCPRNCALEAAPPGGLVFSHGDFCLPNIFIREGRISGFVDLSDAGISDKWRDIALCWRSLKLNMDGSYGGKPHPDFDPDRLFEALGMEPDRERIKYYLLLDEQNESD